MLSALLAILLHSVNQQFPHARTTMPSISVAPALGFAAYSGTGKTTLLEQVIPLLREAGLRLALIKRSHHSFTIDRPGKDSDRLRQAGAQQVIVSSAQRTVHLSEAIPSTERDDSLEQLLQHVSDFNTDLILVEGFKRAALPKIELYRSTVSEPLMCLHDPHIIALACDNPQSVPRDLPLLDINQPAMIAAFILQWWRTQHES